MGQRDTTYQLSESLELDEAFFSTENSDEAKKQEKRKAGAGSQRKSKVLVMIESKAVPENKQKKGKKDRKSGHIKMKVVPDVKASTVTEASKVAVAADSRIITDDSRSHTKLKGCFKEVYPIKTLPEQASKILPWVHTAISNAKSLLLDMYHGIKDEFLQSYLDEFCWKFNRRSFGDRLFDRLVVAAVSYRPAFQHRTYD
jgi:transposase-like protein